MNLKKLEMAYAIDPIEWLNSHDLYPKFYWKSKDADFEVATLGVEKELSDLSEIDNYENMVNVVLDFELDPQKSRIWVPTFELNIAPKRTYQLSHQPHFLKTTKPCTLKKNKIKSNFTTPDFKTWDTSIFKAKKSLQKVVLARKQTIFLEENVDGLFIFSNLKKKSKNSFLFFYQPNPFEAFLGASPEMLFIKNQMQIISESIAGTRKRGENAKQDIFLKHELIKSKKETKEFSFVKDYIESAYKKICSYYNVSNTGICKTKWAQHLHARFAGKLKSDLSTKELINLFHPTPAVGGVPKEKALAFINNFEPFDRLFYAAPIGRASKSYSEFAVGIRSCHIKKNQIDVFAGTGIIDSSNSKDEWEELQIKSNWIFE